MALLTYKVRKSSTPDYLNCPLTNRVINSVTLRSSSKQALHVGPTEITRQTVCGARAFGIAAPTVWNKQYSAYSTISISEVLRRKRQVLEELAVFRKQFGVIFENTARAELTNWCQLYYASKRQARQLTYTIV